MARVKYGSGVQQFLGSIGGVTFSQVATVPTARGWRRPVNKRTARQRARRGPFAQFSSEWFSTLTAAQRTAWVAYAATVTFLNLFGDSYSISGFQMWMRTALLVSQTPDPVSATAPVIPGLPTARTVTTALVHATGVMSAVTILPAGIATESYNFLNKPFDRATRTLPRGFLLGQTNFPGNTATPAVILTYGALPGVAGDFQGFSRFFLKDADNRVTNVQLLSAISA